MTNAQWFSVTSLKNYHAKPKTMAKHNESASGGAFYGLGFIGAAVYFIGKSTGFVGGLLGFLKALVWPAFLVYEALKALKV